MTHQSTSSFAEPARLLDRHVPLGAPLCVCCGVAFLPSVVHWFPASPSDEVFTQPMRTCDACRRSEKMRLDLCMAGVLEVSS